MSNINNVFDGKSFVAKALDVDDKSFVNCKFKRCTLTYSGGNPPTLNGCSFEDCSWKFDAAAARTLGFLSGLYNGGFENVVESTFQEVRKGAAFADVPVASADGEEASKEQSTIFGFKPPRILKISKPLPKK